MNINLKHHFFRIIPACYALVFPVMSHSELLEQKNTISSAGVSASAGGSGYLAQLVIGLLIVLLCIAALAWLAKYLNGFKASSSNVINILDSIRIGSRERIALVQVGEAQLLLGIVSGRINTLHVLNSPLEINKTHSVKTVGEKFSDSLSHVLNRDQ